jgi:hypothetical protein
VRKTARVDFEDIESFLKSLLLETGCPPSEIDEDSSPDNLRHLCLGHLSSFRYLVIVDDVDTLDDEMQQEMLYLISFLFARSRSKALMTARRNLGLPRKNFLELSGLNEFEFADFVSQAASILKIPSPCSPQSSSMAKFHSITGGSPLFAMSVLRLVSLGERFTDALVSWEGADGDAVREAAFSKEVSRLTLLEARVLLCAAYLAYTSPVELSSLLGVSRYEIQRALDTLRQFSMISIESDLPGGATMVVPRTIALTSRVIERRVPNASSLRVLCNEQRSIHEDPTHFVSDAIRRSMAYLRASDFATALSTIETALQRLPDHPDLLCMLGRCKVEAGGNLAADADQAFRRAHEAGSKRRELFEYWIAGLRDRRDWSQVISVATLAESELRFPGRFAESRAEGYIRIGEDLTRALRYDEAEKKLLEGAYDLKGVLRSVSGSLFHDLRSIQQTLIIRWLRVIKMICDQSGRHGRFVGAVIKAGTEFGFFDRNVLLNAFGLIEQDLIRAERSPSRTVVEACAHNIDRCVRFLSYCVEKSIQPVTTEELRGLLVKMEQRIAPLSSRFSVV